MLNDNRSSKQKTIPIVAKVDVKHISPIINFEGSVPKYCISIEGQRYYLKFDKPHYVFAEVLVSEIIAQTGMPVVRYGFVIEKDGDNYRTGTISEDYAMDVSYRGSLVSIAEKYCRLDSSDITNCIYTTVPDSTKTIGVFAKKQSIEFDKADKNQLKTELECQVVADYFLCNGDHHMRNTEVLVSCLDIKKRLWLAPYFDLGNTLRTENAEMAFNFSDPVEGLTEQEKRGDISTIYARNILKHFKSQYKTAEEIAKDPAFKLFKYFEDLSISKEIFTLMNTALGKYEYKNDSQISDDNYNEMIENILPEFNKKLKTNLKMSDVYNMIGAFNYRREVMADEIAKDPILFDAYAQCVVETQYTSRAGLNPAVIEYNRKKSTEGSGEWGE